VTAFLIGSWRQAVEPVSTQWRSCGATADEQLLDRSLFTLAMGGLFPVVTHETLRLLGAELHLLARNGFEASAASNDLAERCKCRYCRPSWSRQFDHHGTILSWSTFRSPLDR
jgi:hypothetical protein